MRHVVSQKVKTNKSVDAIADIAQQELLKHVKRATREGNHVDGRLSDYTGLVSDRFSLAITQREGGYSLDVTVERQFSWRVILKILVWSLIGMLLLLPLVVAIYYMIKARNAIRDPNVPPYDKILENVKAECEF